MNRFETVSNSLYDMHKVVMVIDAKVIDGLRKKFPQVHPLLFQRSVERATTCGELFDILTDIPNEKPLVWDEYSKRWATTADVTQSKVVEE